MSDELTASFVSRLTMHQPTAMSGGPGMETQILCWCREGGWLTRSQMATHQAEQARAVLGEMTTEWRAGLKSEAMEGGGSRAPYTYCERDEARARRLAERDDYDRLQSRTVTSWTEVPPDA